MAYAKSLANRISVSSFKLTAWSQLWHCQTFLSKWKSCQTGLAGHPTLLLVLTKPSLSTGPLGCHRVLWKLETTPGCWDSECSRHEIFRRASLSLATKCTLVLWNHDLNATDGRVVGRSNRIFVCVHAAVDLQLVVSVPPSGRLRDMFAPGSLVRVRVIRLKKITFNTAPLMLYQGRAEMCPMNYGKE